MLPAVRWVELGQAALDAHPEEELVGLVGQDAERKLEVECATGFLEPPADPE